MIFIAMLVLWYQGVSGDYAPWYVWLGFWTSLLFNPSLAKAVE